MAERRGPARRRSHGRRRIDPARRAAYRTLREVSEHDAYANLVLPEALRGAGVSGRDAAFATELTNGTLRALGSYDLIIEAASGRAPGEFDPPLLDVLRLGAHQALAMRVPDHAAVAASVDLAGVEVGERVTGLVNAVMRKIAARDLPAWTELLSAGEDELGAIAIRTHHPRWIVQAYADLLPADELVAALEANNAPPQTWLTVRPGLAEVDELVAAGAALDPIAPFGARWSGDPSAAPGVREGRVGVQDPGSQLVALALARGDAPAGRWLDLCAGPGGKAALLAGLAREHGDELIAAEPQPHRARLVERALRAYPSPPEVVVADGTAPPWAAGSFARVLADVPCSGLGALRRRPEARCRRDPEDIAALRPLQETLLDSALDLAEPGGLVAYVTCSPHRAETAEVLDAVLAARADAEPVRAELPEAPAATGPDGRVQLWPHRDGTDAMFLALLRKRATG